MTESLEKMLGWFNEKNEYDRAVIIMRAYEREGNKYKTGVNDAKEWWENLSKSHTYLIIRNAYLKEVKLQ